METVTTTTQQNPQKQAAVNALAVVGFIVLILLGIGLAIYAARYVPNALNRLGIAGVGDSSSSDDSSANVVIVPDTSTFTPVATSTATSTETVATTTGTGSTNYGSGTHTTYTPPKTIQVPVVVPPPAPFGLPDLTVSITAVGYCSNNDPSSFRVASRVPNNENGGLRFAVKNIGTNVSGRWDLDYEVPSSPSIDKTVSDQKSLNPGDEVDYTLCFTDPRSGNNRDITITVDSNRDVAESNERNNEATAQIDVR